MKHFLRWAFAAVLFMTVSCVKSEKFDDQGSMRAPGVYGVIDPFVCDDAPSTKATINPSNLVFSFEVGDNINIWSEMGTLLIYTALEVNSTGGAIFDGGGFDLTEGMTYYSSFPLIASFKDKMRAVPISYGGQVQTADGDANHVAEYTYLYSSGTCENGSTHLQYHHFSRWVKFALTLGSSPLTITELTLTADSPVFALNGTVDVTTGTFTPGTMTDTMTLELDNVEVTDGELNAYMALAPYVACNVTVSVKDSEDNVYQSPVIAQDDATTPGNFRRITTTVAAPSADAVAKIGSTYYNTISAAVDAVPTDGTPTTITVLKDVKLVEGSSTEWSGITISSTKNVVLELNGHKISYIGPFTGYRMFIENYGALTIKDATDTYCQGAGQGKLIVDPRDPDTMTYQRYSCDVICNYGVLNVESGYIELTSGLSTSYVILNTLGGTVNITGGKFDNKISTGRVVEMYLDSTTKTNTVNIGGTAILEGYISVYLDYADEDANAAELNITGGMLAGSRFAVYSAGAGNWTYDASCICINITDGVFYNRGFVLNTDTEFQSLSVSGGLFYDFLVLRRGGSKFVTGGTYTTVDNFFKGRLPSETVIADGYKVVFYNNYYYVVPESDPREAVNIYPENRIYYYWSTGSGTSGQIIDFYAPLEGPDPIMEDGEFIELIEDVTLTKDVEWVEESSWNTPIFQGGTFGLTFGEFDIDLNGYAFTLPVGVICKTDRQTTIFSAPEGCIIIETAISDGDFVYQYESAIL
ncbi:MAG: hypothetical protein IKX71_00280 [Bacteroidales bacterium]|nr:hypothetical protein [Bacteroidales bacterium]